MNKDLDLDDFSKLRNDAYVIDFNKIYDNIDHIAKSEGVIFSTDSHTSKYYAEKKPFIWISRLGVCNRADTLLHTMLNADAYGFDTERLKVRQIDRDIRLIRSLDVLDKSCDINMIMARLEYNLTKAYFRYSSTLRFGLVNPDHLYNTLEEYEVDSVTTKCRQLSDLRVERPNSFFCTEAVTKGLDPNAPMKDSGVEWIGQIPEKWEIEKIKYISKLKGRIGWQGLTSSEYMEEGPYLITGTDFIDGKINWKTCTHISNERWEQAAEIKIKNGDLLITKDGSVGKVAIVDNLTEKASLNSGVLKIILKY